MRSFDIIEQKVLNRIQRDIPFVPEPFRALAAETGMEEGIFLAAAARLKEEGVLRNIAAIFNAGRLGYVTNLVAFEVDPGAVERAAAIVSAHPLVSHNYLRGHRYNLWFTFAVGGGGSVEEAVSRLAARCGARDHITLKNERLFKIGLRLEIGEADNGEEEEEPPVPQPAARETGEEKYFSDEERNAIALLQEDLPLTARPFKNLIGRVKGDITEERLLEIAGRLKGEGVMRRYAAVLRHRKAGYAANAMTAWKPGGAQGDGDIARVFGSVRNISHLYFRTVIPGKWEHPLFAMIHARSDGELDGLIRDLAKESGIRDYLVLKTLREFKKQRVKYFSEDLKEWERNIHD